MKKLIRRLADEELKKYPINNLVQGWFFRVNEISQGYYRVEAVDEWGRSVSHDGINPDKLINECKNDISQFTQDG